MLNASKKHLALFVSLFVLLLLPTLPATAASFQDDDPDAKALYRYAGTYVLPSGAYLSVEVSGETLAVRPIDVSARFAVGTEERGAVHALDHEAGAVLAGLVAGDATALREALPEHRRDRGTADVQRLFDTFAGAHGAVQGYRILGTVAHDAHRAWTLAQVHFDEGSELVRLTWHRGMLSTIQRGPLPTLGKQPASVVRFRRSEAGGTGIAFHLRPDGSVTSLAVEGLHGTVVAYKLADAPAVASGK